MNVFSAEITTTYYKVKGDITDARAIEIGTALDKYWKTFNSYFHFNSQGAGFLNEVLVFPDKNSYDIYIREKIKQTRDEFVFLKYSSPEKSQLVLFDCGEATFNNSFTRQAFLQYLYSFIKAPPLWLREGFSMFIENARYNVFTKLIEQPESLAWLETAKRLRKVEKPMSVSEILNAQTGTYPVATLYPQAWSLVYFLINNPEKDISRLFWDGLYQLSTKAEIEENTLAMANSFTEWIDDTELTKKFDTWLFSMKTWNELVSSGITYYDAGDFSLAENTFKEAVARNTQESLPYYYLGLICYEQKNYSSAEKNYKDALQRGANGSTVNWALGLNSYADNRITDALNYISEAEKLDPTKYSAKAQALRSKINK